MSVPLEHDYIGWSEDSSSMEGRSSGKISPSSTLSSEDEKNNALNFKATELRLGLPGSESPERKSLFGVSLFGKDLEEKTSGYSLTPLKGFVSGAKRGFSDTMEGSGKWALSGIAGSEADLGGNGNLFSPRGLKSGAETCKKEVAVAVPPSPKPVQEKKSLVTAPAAKAQVVGWPPVRSFRKNTMASNSAKNNVDDDAKSAPGCVYVKVSMDGAPYLRKVDLKTYSNYVQLSSALEKMFSCFTIGQCSSQGGGDGLSERHLKDLIHGSEYVLTYEDKDGDWMLVGDVPWEMFTNTCKRLRIMKGSEAIGLAPRATEKCKNR